MDSKKLIIKIIKYIFVIVKPIVFSSSDKEVF